MEEFAVAGVVPAEALVDAASDKEKRSPRKSTRSRHPYLSGNYWPQPRELHLVPCTVEGQIPACLAGGQFVRNGPNAALPPAEGENYHMFDGDGMIHGVYFQEQADGNVVPLYINKYVRTDIFLASSYWGLNLLPSIASLIDPLSTTVRILQSIIRSGAIAFLSGSTRLSTANTSLVFHDRRLLATCESGPPMHVNAPELETIDWHTFPDDAGRGLSRVQGSSSEWITGHPKVDPVSGELLMFGYDIFQLFNPHIRLSILDSQGVHKHFQKPVYLQSAKPKMMHDFAITQKHVLIMDLPLTMSPFNVATAKPMLFFDANLISKFGVLQRDDPDQIVWFETESCMIFHTVNAWDDYNEAGQLVAFCLVACRFKGAKLVYAAGAIEMPQTGEDVVHLYYYRFDLTTHKISHEYALCDFPIEYPSINTQKLSLRNQYAYGASMREGSFDTALNGAQIDVIVKCDIQALIQEPPTGVKVATSNAPPKMKHVTTLLLPQGCYASEATFVSRDPADKTLDEDDGYLLLHVYDETTQDEYGDAPDDIGSEVWVVCAKTLILPPLAKIKLPQRVPYGLHGLWVSGQQIALQRDATFNTKTGTMQSTRATRDQTSVSLIASFYKWSAIWAGKSALHGVSNGRFAISMLLSAVLAVLLTYRALTILLQAMKHLTCTV
ncbi:carotenoid oxygenase [Protomyces lactucae-debilis]|uniref:Carotenoid oxygenase n=1 Tax=Protomyces lactucae-debilis TaxID=2754530 RepID=A0A1Y2F7G6_PROLT|nr:carotenoid oxygenase [Protomyces lactucae-debilis]ORY79870.1 carotenoid oxygenase [Protomyces lactucae-debilis]